MLFLQHAILPRAILPWEFAALAMGYVLHVWDGPEPVNPDNMAFLLGLLNQDRCRPHPKLLDFAKRLMQRYPYDEDDGPGCAVWTHGAIDGQSDRPIYDLDVAMPSPSVLRFVVETAMMLGLHVHDPQAGRTWFASGRVHPPLGAAERAQRNGPDRLTFPELKRAVNEALYGFLETDGFFLERDGARLVRRIDGGTQGVRIDAVSRTADWEIGLGFYWRFEAVEEIRSRLFAQPAPDGVPSRLTDSLLLDGVPGGRRIHAATAQDVRRAIVTLQPVIVQQVLPRLDARTSLRAFADARLLADAAPFDVADRDLAVRLLIAARLSRSPGFGGLVLRLAQAWKAQSEDLRANLAGLLKYLREVDPDNIVLPPA